MKSPAAIAAAKCSAIVDVRARRRAALAVMRMAAREVKPTLLASALEASAKSWIRACGLGGDEFSRTLAREYASANKGQLCAA